MTDNHTILVQEKLSIVSYNCHGYNNSLSYLSFLTPLMLTVVLQEHWFSDSELCKLCFDDVATHAISSFDISALLHILSGAVPFFIIIA